MEEQGKVRTALVLYGTETGNAQELAEEVGRVTERLRFSTTILELDEASIFSVVECTVAIFVVSTTGQGEFPSNSKKFWTTLLKKRHASDLFQTVSYCVVGLGDSSYPRFNWAARKLDKRLSQLGAKQLIARCETDEQSEDGVDGTFLTWLPLFKDSLQESFPLLNGLLPISNEEPLLPKWVLERLPARTQGSFRGNLLHEGEDEPFDSSGLEVEHLELDSRPLRHSFQVKVEQNDRMTLSSHWQDVRLMKFSYQGRLDYFPGDALSILPKNFPADVGFLIRLMDWVDIADCRINFTPTSISSSQKHSPECPIPPLHPRRNPKLFTLRYLLLNYLDITSIPRRSHLAAFAAYASDPIQQERLLEFAQPQYLDEYYDYATRSRRSILEILQEFDSVKIPWSQAANVLPVLRPRSFSIASSSFYIEPLKAKTEPTTTNFDLLVAIVQYRTVIKKVRQGVCTRYLAALRPGSTLNVTLRTDGRFCSKQKTSPQPTPFHMRPKLLIGAGTGIAPLRSVIQQDHAEHNAAQTTRLAPTTTLVFGCRSPEADYFFESEWSALSSPPMIAPVPSQSLAPSSPDPVSFQIIPAFSRPTPPKERMYVQHALSSPLHHNHIYDLLTHKHALVVVCGSSGAMPRGVREALVGVLIDGFENLEREARGSERTEGSGGIETTDTASLRGKNVAEGGRRGDENEDKDEDDGGGKQSAVNGKGRQKREEAAILEDRDTNATALRKKAEAWLAQMEKEGRYLLEAW